MKDATPQPVRLADYSVPAWLIDRVDLTFRLQPSATRVMSKIAFRPNPEATDRTFRLDGENLKLISAQIDGAPVEPQIDATGLTLDVPDRAFTWEAEVEISADRVGHVVVGMEARLKILSYDFTRFGEIVGQVAAISPNSFQTETGETVFRVRIALPNEGQNAALVGRPIRPGMTVTADILTDSKKVLSYLLKPLRVLSDRAFTEA